MAEKTDIITALIKAYLADDLSASERMVLEAWLDEDPANWLLLLEFTDEERLKTVIVETYASKERIWQQLRHRLGFTPEKPEPIKPHRKLLAQRWWWATAASVVIALSVWGYYYLNPILPQEEKTVLVSAYGNDATPGGNHAILTLADGSQIVLDSARNGQLTNEGGMQVIQLDSGVLAYKGNAQQVVYHTLSTPRGGQYQVVLPDGTKMWLNAASSISYPTAFVGAERKVTLTGEGYFEVAKNEAKKFIVMANGTTTEVLGTHFNISAYSDEADTKVTLLEGAVRLSLPAARAGLTKPGAEAVLKPGQQAVYNPGNRTALSVLPANTLQAIAWKEGVLDMDGQSFATIMRQLSRWYDVEVAYENGVPDIRLAGQMDRGLNLSQVLKGLEMMHVSFTIQGKKLIVKK